MKLQLTHFNLLEVATRHAFQSKNEFRTVSHASRWQFILTTIKQLAKMNSISPASKHM